MDVPQLRAFLKVIQSGSFTRAARELGVTQPAISQQIARLEAELGRPLFERRGRRITPTDAGEKLRERAIQVVSLCDDASRLVRDDGESGRLVVSAIPTIAPYLLPPLLSEFRKKHPETELEVHEDVTADILERCAHAEIDLGILALPAERKNLQVQPLFEEELLLVLPRDHRLARKARVKLDDLQDEPLILLNEAHCLSHDIRSFCLRKRFHPVAAGRTAQLTTVQELVALGHGVSFIPEMARRLDRSPARVYRSLDGSRPTRTVAACWNRERFRPRALESFVSLLRSDRQGGTSRQLAPHH